MKIIVDDIPLELQQPDIDGDGQTGGIEKIKMGKDFDKKDIQEPSELGQALEELNRDEIEDSKLTTIDMRGRLHHSEVSSILALDALVSLRILPSDMLSFTRRKKRLSVSVAGLGRKEIVDITAGKNERDSMKLGERVAGWFGKNQ